MTLEQEARNAFRQFRQLVAMEDDVLELIRRQERVPSTLTRIDGFGAGGNGGGAATRNDAGQPSSTTERAMIQILEADEPGARQADPVGELVVSALWTLLASGEGSQRARTRFVRAAKMSSLRRPQAHVAEDCAQDGCGDLAHPDRKGNCAACYQWLYNHPGVRCVPRSVLERRNERRSGKGVHADGPLAPSLDPVVERLVDDFEDGAA